MYVICERCKSFINIRDIDKGSFVLRKNIGIAYVPEYNCKTCLAENKDKSLHILERAYPVLLDKRK